MGGQGAGESPSCHTLSHGNGNLPLASYLASWSLAAFSGHAAYFLVFFAALSFYSRDSCTLFVFIWKVRLIDVVLSLVSWVGLGWVGLGLVGLSLLGLGCYINWVRLAWLRSG